MHFRYSLCSVLFTYTQPCEHYRVHLYWVQVKLLWGEGWGLIRDKKILVLVHSTKRESASLPITGATNGASQKWYHAYKKKTNKKRQQGYFKMAGNWQGSLRWSSVNGDTKEGCCSFCVIGGVAPKLLSAVVAKGKKSITVCRHEKDKHSRPVWLIVGEGIQQRHCEHICVVCCFAFESSTTKRASAVQLFIEFYITEYVWLVWASSQSVSKSLVWPKCHGRQTDVSKKEYIHTKCPRRVKMETVNRPVLLFLNPFFCLQFSPHVRFWRNQIWRCCCRVEKCWAHVSSLPYKVSQPKTEPTRYFHIR